MRCPPSSSRSIPRPSAPRSRLLRLDAATGRLEDLAFADLPALVDTRDVLVLNDTRVIKARLAGRKASGGQDRALRRAPGRAARGARAHPRQPCAAAGHRAHRRRWRPCRRCSAATASCYRCASRRRCCACSSATAPCRCRPTSRMRPTPPTPSATRRCTRRAPGRGRRADRRPAFRRGRCSSASPRSGVRLAYLTLHVGAGTFQPVRVDERRGPSHAQRAVLVRRCRAATRRARAPRPPRGRGRHDRAARARERWRAAAGRAERARPTCSSLRASAFASVDRLLTNFHLPRSTPADAGRRLRRPGQRPRAPTRTPSRARYRFFRYGDAMLIERAR